MATYVLKWADAGGNGNVINPDCAGDLVVNRYVADLASAPLKGVTLAAGDIIDCGIIPAYTSVLDVIIDADDLDTGTAALTFDVGTITGTPGDAVSARTCGAEFFSASTIAQAGGVARMTLKTGLRVAPVAYDRSIGIKIVAAADAQATSGVIGLNVLVK